MRWRADRGEFPRTPMRASFLFIAAAALSPVAARAQESPAADSVQRTHTVKKRDTLWDLANTYLGDPFKWPAIYQINRDVVEDPHWIFPGEVLKLPGKTAVIAEAPKAEEPKTDEPKADTTKVEAAKADTTKPEAVVDTTKVESAIEKLESPAIATKPLTEPPPVSYDASIFVQSGRTRRNAEERPRIIPAVQPPVSTVRLGEFLAAPFVDQSGGPRGPGRVVERADISSVREMSEQEIFQLYDNVLVMPPVGNVSPEGERFISYTFGPYLQGIGQVVVPTGVVEVTRAPRRGEYAVARVVRLFGDMRPDQKLMPYDSSALATRGRPQNVSDGRWASIQWVQGEPVVPSVQTYAVLNIGSRDGVQLGDEFELFRERIPPQDGGQLTKPEVSIARAQVVRVTPFGTTVVIKSQEQPKIEKGTMARMSAKMP
jgi:LysM repeat protein